MSIRITDVQLCALEGCLRNALQKIGDMRKADQTVREILDNPRAYEASYIRQAEKLGRHCETLFIAAIDEVRDEATKVVVPLKLDEYYAGLTSPTGIKLTEGIQS